MSGVGGEPLMLGTAFRVQAKRCRDSLEQRGFPGAVLSDEERYRCVERQLGQMRDGGYGIRIVSRRGPERPLSGNGLNEDARNRGCEFGAALFHLTSIVRGPCGSSEPARLQ